jgi:hypothetical protein
MIPIMPGLFSLLAMKPAANRMRIVMGIAAMVKPNSAFWWASFSTMTINCTVKPRKKKKSNLSKAM